MNDPESEANSINNMCLILTNVGLPPSFPLDLMNESLVLYRITPRQYQEGFLKNGTIRIRKLSHYHTIECEKRRDKWDGKTSFDVSWNTDLPNQTLESHAKLIAAELDLDLETVLNTCELLIDVSETSLVFCLTGQPTISLLQEFGDYPIGSEGSEDFEGVASHIYDLVKFKSLLDQQVCEIFKCDQSVLRNVVYMKKEGPYNESRYGHTAFSKDVYFANESEWRFVWKISLENANQIDPPDFIHLGNLDSCAVSISRLDILNGVEGTLVDYHKDGCETPKGVKFE